MSSSWNKKEESSNSTRGSIDITQRQFMSDEERISHDPPSWYYKSHSLKNLNLEKGKKWKPSKIISIWSKHMVKMYRTLWHFNMSHVIKLTKTMAHLHV